MFSRVPALSSNIARNGMMVARVNGINAARNYATLKEVEMRLKSIKNIEKITKTMKIVASTRLGKAEKAKNTSKNLSETDEQFFKNAETKTIGVEGKEPKELVIAITSDKGLCGSIHSQLAKAVRAHLKESPAADVVTIGDKIKLQMLRSNANNLKASFNGVGKEAPTFYESSLITEKLINEFKLNDYQKISIYYNNPVTSLSFEPSSMPVFNIEAIEKSPSFEKFEIDADGKVSTDLFEYNLSCKLLSAMAQGHAAEISARRNAMDNASKNAGDMISRYSILYNRTRQAVITNELVDIITGASSLD
ncbi:hypothetical protein TPHA_0M00850 [Tetrapisispora phaffii CBS 4417]|uniref:ATP synthase subunit gamma n=1 Tax=Tetrapisispora phaffii (strain ATCC 24235 / CBS 4417 / NBRC 1672 / NRRL Y-8282 / UCD 70-5) TaxID=1071381 RepID=G8C0E5_TETPH|nr:hypothetical protein TPHA_0M00850 [Tetrapisispora phaffii CBS 4417]CCE65660.1 hypothetical protein TPHA_0M00850 [Tetrapisispora phaffii CBS 4417]